MTDLFSVDPINNDVAFKLGALIRDSNIIFDLNDLGNKFKWDYATRYDHLTYNIKLYGVKFLEDKVIDISFDLYSFENKILCYREEKRKEGRVKIPTEMTFNEILLVSSFIERIIQEYKLINGPETKQDGETCVQTAFDLFDSSIVKVI